MILERFLRKKMTMNNLKQKTQIEKFCETARELESDESPERFERTLKKIVKSALPAKKAKSD